MLGRYAVELLLILLCGLGLHALEVERTGGAEVFVKFSQVSATRIALEASLTTSSLHMLAICSGSQQSG